MKVEISLSMGLIVTDTGTATGAYPPPSRSSALVPIVEFREPFGQVAVTLPGQVMKPGKGCHVKKLPFHDLNSPFTF